MILMKVKVLLKILNGETGDKDEDIDGMDGDDDKESYADKDDGDDDGE